MSPKLTNAISRLYLARMSDIPCFLVFLAHPTRFRRYREADELVNQATCVNTLALRYRQPGYRILVMECIARLSQS